MFSTLLIETVRTLAVILVATSTEEDVVDVPLEENHVKVEREAKKELKRYNIEMLICLLLV